MRTLQDSNSQLEFARQMELYGEAEREMEIRRIAREYAERPIPPDDYLGMPVVVSMLMPRGQAYVWNRVPSTVSTTLHDIQIKVDSAIQGPARVIIAEAQIREQLGVDDL